MAEDWYQELYARDLNGEPPPRQPREPSFCLTIGGIVIDVRALLSQPVKPEKEKP